MEVQEVTKDMYLTDLLMLDRNIAGVLMGHGLHCLGCMLAAHETLEQACMVHGVDADQVLADIKKYLEEKE